MCIQSCKGGDTLALDVINQIVDIEKEGDDLVLKAESYASDIRKTADENAKKIVDGANLKAQTIHNEIIQNYEAEADKIANGIFEDNKTKTEKLKNLAESRKDDAVKMIIGRIVSGNGNS